MRSCGPTRYLAAGLEDLEELVLARSASEARELAAALPRCQVVDLGLPEHGQLTMC
ncbi:MULTISPECIES: hypothetical protein [Streptomyces]|uniref:Uncharacterized protein n=1 Tax=Streptomyces chilikensis TaxID=1194079 RepID=A0ABV3EJL1_9ACTN|nr:MULTISPECIES: hypothetical protein [Streptomyces]MDH6228896.1 hypothetical protein [Streptomyces sp. MJP52]